MRISRNIAKTLAIAAIGALSLTACGGSSNTPEASADPNGLKLVAEGKFNVCANMPYKPFEFVEDGKNVGFDMDLAGEIAKDLGLELVVTNASFESIESGLFSTKCDAAISGLSITDKRKTKMEFSTPYLDDDLTLVAVEGSGITDIESAKGKDVGVQVATTGLTYAKEHGLIPVEFETGNEQIMSLENGRTVASLGNQSTMGYAMKGNPKLKRVQDFPSGEKLGVAVGLGNTALLEKVNGTLKRMEGDGTMAKFKETWFDIKK